MAADGSATTVTPAPGPARLLAYGDSLTAGYTRMGTEFHPYADVLSSAWGVGVDHIGMSGFTTEEFLEHLDDPAADVCDKVWPGLNEQLSKHAYSGVLILGGTNDLASLPSAEEVVATLAKIHSHCHAKGIRTVALSVPSSQGCERLPEYNAVRLDVNAKLREFCESAEAGGMAMFVDTNAMVPFSTESGVWDHDGLHMTKQGYGTLGTGIAQLSHVKEFLLGPGSAEGTPGAGDGGRGSASGAAVPTA